MSMKKSHIKNCEILFWGNYHLLENKKHVENNMTKHSTKELGK